MLPGSNSTSQPHDGGSATTVNQSISYPIQAFPSIKDVARLKQNGSNFRVWERQLKVVIRQMTGMGVDYLDQQLLPSADQQTDHAIFSILLWSLDETLQGDVDLKLDAGGVFRYFKHRFTSSILVPTSLGTGLVPPSTIQNGTLRHLRPTYFDSSGNERYIDYEVWVQSLRDKERALLRPSHLKFINLPPELINRILDYVETFSSYQRISIKYKKLDRVEKAHGDHWQYPPQSGYYPTHLPPILNSLQSLASVNKKMYDLCRPRLWKSLKFPTDVPFPIHNWTVDYLFKHGDFVKTISLVLNEMWYSDDEDDIAAAVPYDNLYRYSDPNTSTRRVSPRGLSHESTVKILTMCPNVRKLRIELPSSRPEPSQRGLNRLQNRLKKILSRLNGLEDFELVDKAHNIPEKFAIDMIQDLPMLTSLCFHKVGQTGTLPPTKPLAWYLTRLEHLKSLQLTQCCSVDGSWRLYTWPRLTTLNLTYCENISFVEAHDFVNHFSSHLTHLELSLSPRHVRTGQGLSARWAFENRFNLPELTRLGLLNSTTFHLLIAFEDCKNLEDVNYSEMPATEWPSIQEIICKPSWPKLESFTLSDESGESRPRDADWNVWLAKFQIKKYFHQSGIEFFYDVLNDPPPPIVVVV